MITRVAITNHATDPAIVSAPIFTWRNISATARPMTAVARATSSFQINAPQMHNAYARHRPSEAKYSAPTRSGAAMLSGWNVSWIFHCGEKWKR